MGESGEVVCNAGVKAWLMGSLFVSLFTHKNRKLKDVNGLTSNPGVPAAPCKKGNGTDLVTTYDKWRLLMQ